MNNPHVHEIRVEGLLTDRWSDWFEDLEIRHHANGETALIGTTVDQAALLGVLLKIHGVNTGPVYVNRMPTSNRRTES